MVDLAYIESLCTIIDHQMKEMNKTKASAEYFRNLRAEAEKKTEVVERIKEMYDCFFAFAMVWSFGACLDENKREFNGYLRSMCTKLKFPEAGTVYDYFYDPIENKWIHWIERVKSFNPDLMADQVFS